MLEIGDCTETELPREARTFTQAVLIISDVQIQTGFISKYSCLRTHTLEIRTREEKTINNDKLLNLLAFNGIHFAVRRFRVTATH